MTKRKNKGRGVDQWAVEGSRKVRDRYLRFVVLFLDGCRLSPGVVSFIGFLFVFVGAFFLVKDPVVGVGCFGIGIFFDGLDGPLARIQKRDSERGEIVDMLFDTAGLVAIGTSLVVGGSVEIGWGTLYVINYVLMEILIFRLMKRGGDFFVPVRTRTWLFFVLLAEVVFDWSIVGWFAVIVGIYMLFANVFMILKLRK